MDLKSIFPKNNRSWFNIQDEEDRKKSTAERAAERKAYEMKIKEMQDEHDAAVAKAKKDAVQAAAAVRHWKQEEVKAVKVLSDAQRKYVEKMRGVTMRMKKQIEQGKLKKEDIPMCKYHCTDEACWAYDGVSGNDKTCPHVHKDQAGWNKGKCPKKGGKRVTRRRRA